MALKVSIFLFSELMPIRVKLFLSFWKLNNPYQPIGLGVHFLRRPGYFGRAGGTGRGQGSNAPQNLAVPKGAYISLSPKKFWTFLRQCLAPHALQLGLQNEFAEWNLSIKGNYICREQQLLRPRKQYFCCELIRFIQAFRFDLMLPVLKHSKRAKFSKNVLNAL